MPSFVTRLVDFLHSRWLAKYLLLLVLQHYCRDEVLAFIRVVVVAKLEASLAQRLALVSTVELE